MLEKFSSDKIVRSQGILNSKLIEYKKAIFTFWDLKGVKEERSFWRLYYQNADCIVFVVDSSDESRFEEAFLELHLALSDVELKRDTPVLVLANRHDKQSVSREKLIKALKLEKIVNQNVS